jgi:hypothetical protein
MKKAITILLLLILVFILGCNSTEDFDYYDDVVPEVNRTPEGFSDEDDIEYDTPDVEEEPNEEIIDEENLESQEKQEIIEEIDFSDCDAVEFTQSPVEINMLNSITPLGNLNPLEHTLPTTHTYWHVASPYLELYSPGDIRITNIRATRDLKNSAQEDYGLDFSLCSDVSGYFLHIVELSDLFKDELNNLKCWSNDEYEWCNADVSIDIEAGDLIGYVSETFYLGMRDKNKMTDFANNERYYDEIRQTTCPLNYFEQSVYYLLSLVIERDLSPRCGQINYDVPGTLQGNWYKGDYTFSDPESWDNTIAFVYDNQNPEIAAISFGGVIAEPNVWKFVPNSKYTTNRRFDEVVSGQIFCYDDYKNEGRIIVELLENETLKVEHQFGRCSGSFVFNDYHYFVR